MSSVIKTENLTYVYGGNTPRGSVALNNVNIEIEKGSFVGLIGHTGSGKSTLVSHLNGLLEPTEGKVIVDGEDLTAIKNKRHIRYKVGLCFQYPEHQLFEETVYKDIAFGPTNKGMSKEEIDKSVRNAISFVGLSEDYLTKSPFDLSGGEKRRVAIAGIIAMDPDVLILDEPTAGLDPKGRDDILNNINEYHLKYNKTVILVSHRMEDIAKYADTVIVMENGRVMISGSVKEVFADADKLVSVGLDIPQITSIFLKLAQKGYDVSTSVFSVSEAVKELVRIKEGK